MKKLVLMCTLVLGVISASWASKGAVSKQVLSTKVSAVDTIYCVNGIGFRYVQCPNNKIYLITRSVQVCKNNKDQATDEANRLSQQAADKAAEEYECPTDGEGGGGGGSPDNPDEPAGGGD